MNSELPIQVSALRTENAQTLSSPEYILLLALSDGISLTGATDQRVNAGALLFLSPFSGRTLHLPAGSNALYAVIPATLLEPLMGIPKRAAVLLLEDGSTSAREKLIEYFDVVLNDRSASRTTQVRIAYELLSALEPAISNEASDRTVSTMKPNKLIEGMVQYVEENFREPLVLGDLAEAFSVTRQYVSMAFHRELGIPFSEFLTRLRLEEAHRLLMTTDRNITEITGASGFPNLKAFNQAFRGEYGVSPKEFRKQRTSPEAASEPTAPVLRDVNQLLRPYRLVYQKHETAIHLEQRVDAGSGTPLEPRWNILNIDNGASCLQSSVQASLTAMQEELHFQYVRLLNLLTDTTVPFVPSQEKHRFTDFLRVMEFFRRIGMTPILVLGERYDVMVDGVLLSDGYMPEPEMWYSLLQELLEASVDRWGVEWVSSWCFEFHMPETLYGVDSCENFMELFHNSAAMIRSALPRAKIGGPDLPVDSAHMGRLQTWFSQVWPEDVDFISVELWADYTCRSEHFRSMQGDSRTLQMLEAVQNADSSLAGQKAAGIRAMMEQHGLSDKALHVSALGITKYQAASAQAGGHCAAHLIRCGLELSGMADGIGCWKAFSGEAEYLDEYQVLGSGCGMIGRYDLKNINYYAQVFLGGLMPYKLFQGVSCIVTTDRSGSYAAILHNCKNYSPYFCRHYLEPKAMDFDDPRLYVSSAALEQTIHLVGVEPSRYRVEQYLIGDHHGCMGSVLKQMGALHIPGEHEIGYIAGQALPYQHAYELEAEDSLDFAVTLQANEVMLLRIHPIRRK